jgi:glycosyltransferase involved in cell wall biosynthesis
MYVSFNKNNYITAISENPFSIAGQVVKRIEKLNGNPFKFIGQLSSGEKKEIKDLKVAFICNWNDACGISTYTNYLVKAIIPKVKEVHVFSERTSEQISPDENFVTRCWERGYSMISALEKIFKWKPDLIIIQHEFGLFPKAGHFLQMLQAIEHIPYLLTLHSVYEHLDKSICTAAIKNIVVHTEQGKAILEQLGNKNNIFVVPHGCVKFKKEEKEELWNIFQTPYAIVQFGFGFFYKGVDIAIDAIHQLKSNDPKFKEIFYCYLCSDNNHTNIIHNNYYNFLYEKIKALGLTENIVIVRKFQTDKIINNYLRTAKLAVFPYRTDPKNVVYGASGAVRIAMANNCPVIVSKGHQFDDLEGVVPRIGDATELAKELDHIFSNHVYKNQIIDRMEKYIDENTWDISADRYLSLYKKISPTDIFSKITQ